MNRGAASSRRCAVSRARPCLSRQETSELRNELLTVYRNVAKLVPAATYEMLASAMAAVMQAGDVAFQEVGHACAF
jgi:hypothetical protein